MHGYEQRGRPLGPQDDVAAAQARRDVGVRQTRRISNWTAAAAIAGVAAGAGYFAHMAATPAGTAASNGATSSGVAGTSAQKPSLTHPVVTSGGSAVAAGSGSAAGGTGPAGRATHWQDN